MRLRTNVIIQVLGTALQGANLAAPFIHNPNSQAVFAAVVGSIQMTAALLAQFSNPDGTPASVAYDPTRTLTQGGKSYTPPTGPAAR